MYRIEDMNSSRFLHPSVTNVSDHSVLVGHQSVDQINHLVLDSRFGIATTPPTNTNINTTTNPAPTPTIMTLEQRIPKAKRMRVRAVEFPVQFYQYSADLQNTSFAVSEVVDESETTSIVTIPNGNYTATQIAAELTTTTPGTNLAFSVVQGKIRVSNSSTTPIALSFAVTPDATFDRNRLKQKLGWCLGFRQATYIIPPNDGTVDGTIDAEGWFRQYTIQYVYLMVNDYSTNRQTTMTTCAPPINGDVLARITLDYTKYPIGNALPATEANGYLWSGVRTYSSGSTTLDRLALHFCDEGGRPLYLNQSDFSIGLEIEHC
jgi:hypothetical protein